MYRQYANTEVDAMLQVSDLTIEEEKINIEANIGDSYSYKGINYHFELINGSEKNSQDFYDYLNSQPVVTEKYANGTPVQYGYTEEIACINSPDELSSATPPAIVEQYVSPVEKNKLKIFV